MKKLLTTIAALVIATNAAAFEITTERIVTNYEEMADNIELCLEKFMTTDTLIPLITFMSKPCMVAATANNRIEAMEAMLEADKKELSYSKDEAARIDAAYERIERARAGIRAFTPNEWLEEE